MIYLILGLILFVYIIRNSNTKDLITSANINTDEDIKKFNEESLRIKSTPTSCILLAICLISTIIIALIRHTTFELFFMNYFGNGLYRKDIEYPFTWYALPFFIIIVRNIIIDVNIGDYVKKHYNLTEEEIDITAAAKNFLVKQKKVNKPSNEVLDETLTLTATSATKEAGTTQNTQPTTSTPQQQVVSTIPQPVANPVPQPVTQPVVEPPIDKPFGQDNPNNL